MGWPYIETLENSKNEVSEAWAFSKNNTKVIWTPRWTLDESLGGTNFLRYKDDFLNLFEENIDIDFLIRPHPMMFENFLLSGQMSSDEIDLFYLKVNSSQNIRIDKSIRYESTLWESDFLISDYSSLTVQYFVTGKPMIYCVTENPELNYTNMFLSILDANYVAHNFDEVKK